MDNLSPIFGERSHADRPPEKPILKEGEIVRRQGFGNAVQDRQHFVILRPQGEFSAGNGLADIREVQAVGQTDEVDINLEVRDGVRALSRGQDEGVGPFAVGEIVPGEDVVPQTPPD
ncbi:hypothetical protein [Lyngbya sp. CCY1209]|jgi:hypothetical protein|uniref:hypothetical protein n=1 Tax=Lyngbya sp. CCY1209 TaxID=2886103 RepID=UPI002D20DE20|nr:hypothetical protein [Lyngbya sp. CCY1209]MEB3884607.1 hypothetical protein [Lyngbya sp. CCY1209]